MSDPAILDALIAGNIAQTIADEAYKQWMAAQRSAEEAYNQWKAYQHAADEAWRFLETPS